MNKLKSCDTIQEILPWYVNQTLAAEERLAVRTHLRDCSSCVAEAEWLAQVQSGMHQPASPGSKISAAQTNDAEKTNASFEHLHSRVASERKRRDRWQMLAAASVLLAVATLVGSMFTSYLLEPRFRTVTDTTVPANEYFTLEVRFSSQAPLASLREVMQATDAILVDGPDASGRVILELPVKPGSSRAQVLQELRADPAVIEVEEMNPASARPTSAGKGR